MRGHPCHILPKLSKVLHTFTCWHAATIDSPFFPYIDQKLEHPKIMPIDIPSYGIQYIVSGSRDKKYQIRQGSSENKTRKKCRTKCLKKLIKIPHELLCP
jgi:hypothetical protein